MAKNEFLKLARNKIQHSWTQFRIYNRTPKNPNHRREVTQIRRQFLQLLSEVTSLTKRMQNCRDQRHWRKLVRETENHFAEMDQKIFNLQATQFKEAREII